MEAHDALRTVEAKLHKYDSYISSTDPVWSALDGLWRLVVHGGTEITGTPL